MARLAQLALLLSTAAVRTHGAPAGDAVTALPGWNSPFRSAQYSGYLTSVDGAQIHYHLVESEGTPKSDPLVIWLNGGPGCSSLIGQWLENGPFTMGMDGSISENAGRWNAAANVLFIESPIGVGFSFQANRSFPYRVDDNVTAAQNVAALLNFYTLFPEFSANNLFISGESYAGVYVPMFAAAILATPAASGVPLKGILVGNGAAATGDWYEGGLVQQRMQHAYNHGLFSATLKASIDGNCTNWVTRSSACNALLDTMSSQIGPLNAYNIEITCLDGATRTRTLHTGAVDAFGPMDGLNPCTAADDALTAYLNRADVQAALHVTAGAKALGAWSECASGRDLAYTRIPQDETKTVYPGLLKKIAVLIFNGDQDECIPYIQDQTWTAAMGFPVKTEWRPWTLSNEVAGYVTEYTTDVRFTFATVKRAGHEVPMYQPARALAMMQRFVAGQQF